MMYRLLINNMIKKQGFYKVKYCGNGVFLFRHGVVARKFDSYKECYNFLKTMKWLELM